MKPVLLILAFFLALQSSAQVSVKNQLATIVAEGQRLYRSERCSWIGSDLLKEKLSPAQSVSGYFSYPDRDKMHFVLYAGDTPRVVGEAIFDAIPTNENARISLGERSLSDLEQRYHRLREASVAAASGDEFYRFYENTKFNFIPLIDSLGPRMYIMTASEQPGHVIHGNDYLLRFSEEYKILSRKRIHERMFELKAANGAKPLHSHTDRTGKFITPTDLCNYMLHAKNMGWQGAYVIYAGFTTYWDTETGNLSVSE